MLLQTKSFRNGQIQNISKTQVKALLGETTNPGAMFTYQQILVVHTDNKTFTLDEQEKIKLLITQEKKGGKNVAESRN